MFVIKLSNGTDIRRITVNQPISLVELTELAKSLFRGTLPPSFILQYKDDEQEQITVTCDRELEEAFRLFKDQGLLRVCVVHTAEKVVTSPAVATQTPSRENQREKQE
jgi:predicted transcriptional regulator